MRVIGLLTLAAVLHTTAFAQKPADPEARNKRAVSVSSSRATNSEQTQYEATSVPKSGSSSARDLAKIEQSSIHQVKASPKKNAGSKPGSPAVFGKQPQTKGKPIKFSYQPPKTTGKTSAKNPAPAAGRSRPAH